ncbi:MAG: thioesterase domain-containing protein [Kiritimatiellales bacterium]|nr:thioesterase domain-containing protein [Kiritimatiellales bacterium]
MKKTHLETSRLFDAIVPAQAMQISIGKYTGSSLILEAPLLPNINDKGTAFAGSISSLLTLAGWGLATLRLRDANIMATVAVAKSETDFKRPVTSGFSAVAQISDEELEQLVAQLSAGSRGRISINTELWSADELCATMHAHYVAFPASGK